MKIQAAVLNHLDGPVHVETVDVDEPMSGEVPVKMGAAGVCHSGYHPMAGEADSRRQPPWYLARRPRPSLPSSGRMS